VFLGHANLLKTLNRKVLDAVPDGFPARHLNTFVKSRKMQQLQRRPFGGQNGVLNHFEGWPTTLS
jgi:hypothetical protein